MEVLSFYAAGTLKTLIKQISAYIADTVALQEICWTGSGILVKQDCTLFYSCDNKDNLVGMGFLVSTRIKHLIIDFTPIAPKICALRMTGKFFNYSIVNGYAPTEIYDDDADKDGFFDALERAYDISPRNYIKIVLDDFNAQVGKELSIFPQLAIKVFTISQTTMDLGWYSLQYRGI